MFSLSPTSKLQLLTSRQGVFKMTDKMKLGLVFGAIVAVFIIQVIAGAPVEAEANTSVVADNLRLRVIANSDDSFDQVVKRVAVFAIEEFMNQHEDGYTFEFLVANLETIREIVRSVLAEIGVQMDIEVSFGHHYFQADSGYYLSLVVRLGEGNGENWWCFINPGVCARPTDEYVSVNTAQVEVRTEIQDNLGTRALNFIGGLFGGGESREVVEGEIDWFLFDDER